MRRLLISVAAAAVSAAVMVGSTRRIEAAPPLTDVRIQLKWKHQFQFAGFYAALAQGDFQRAGLNVRLIEGGPSINPVNEVVAGRAEFGIGTSGLLVSRSQGQPIVAVAGIFQHSPYVLIARKDPSITTVKDLEGKRVMVEPFAEELIAYLHHEHVNVNKIHMVEHSGNPLDLASGTADAMTAYTTTEPFILDQAGIPYRVFDPKLAGIDFYGDTLFTTETFAHEHPALVVALRGAMVQGWLYAFGHRDEIIALIDRQYHSTLTDDQERFAANEIRRLLIPDLIEIGYMNRARWEHIANQFRAAGLLKREVDLDTFLFTPPEPTDWTVVYRILAISGLAVIVIGIALGKFYRLNRALQAEIQRRQVLEAEIQRQSVTDAGTGVLNRRGFMEALRREMDSTARDGRPVAVLTLDFDDFKRINDTYGHAVGDRALEVVVASCRGAVRDRDVVGRMGGDEFLIAMPDTDLDAARAAAERIRGRVAGTTVPLPDTAPVSITTSIGLVLVRDDESVESVLARSDRAVYAAKRLGRNRVVAGEDE